MWYDGFERGKQRGAQRVQIIPAWMKGDRCIHKPTGIYGEVVCLETKGGELVKFRGGGMRKCAIVHATDLEMRP